jgi:hypothetical protein
MSLNSLYLYHTHYPEILKAIEEYSDQLISLHYIKFIKDNNTTVLFKHIETLIIEKKIETFFILLDKSDSSLDIYLLQSLKQKYHLKIIFIFMDSINSFEYIDRYFAQLAHFVIVDNTPHIFDFYSMLEIPVIQFKSEKTSIQVREKHIFSSALTNLCSEKPLKNGDTLTKEKFLSFLEKEENQSTLLLDSKFIYSQKIYKIYWNIYYILEHKKISHLFLLINFKYFKEILSILKLTLTMLNSKAISSDEPIKLINKALYKVASFKVLFKERR